MLDRLASVSELAAELEERIVNDQRSGSGIVDDELELRRRQTHVQIIEHSARPRDRQPADQVRDRIQREHGNDVARCEAQRAQGRVKGCDAVAQLPVAPAQPAVNDRLAITEQPVGPLERRPDVLAHPPASVRFDNPKEQS